jgi:selenocysteine lyase/cysteine desulfurase
MNDAIRDLFPVTDQYVYLNHAAASPLSIPVQRRMNEHVRDLLDAGHAHWREWGQALEDVRGIAARLVNCGASEIAFTANTSSGLSAVANGISWRAGDNMVTADCEFPANLIPWLRIERELGIEVRRATEVSYRIDTEAILSLVDDRTKVISLSFVEFASGFRNDLPTIGRFCRERGILFVVDAIQGLGALTLDVERDHIDAFSADGHKFLLGPEGAALLYLGPRAMELVRPTMVGWTSVENPFSFGNASQMYASGARRFEAGTLNTTGVLGLGAAMELFLRTGVAAIESYLLDLTSYLGARLEAKGYEVLSSRAPGETSAIICCRHPRHIATALNAELEKQRIITTARLGRLRISPHFYNTRDDIDRLITALPD